MLTDQEVENVKSSIALAIQRTISKLYGGFRELEEAPLKSFNNKKRELRNNLVDELRELNDKIQNEL